MDHQGARCDDCTPAQLDQTGHSEQRADGEESVIQPLTSTFAKSHPTSLGCRISELARPEFVVEIEVAAVDPLDAS